MNIREVISRIRSYIQADAEAQRLLDFLLDNEGDPASDTPSLIDEIDTAYNG